MNTISRAVAEAKSRLVLYEWYQGVCLDFIASRNLYEEVSSKEFNEIVGRLVLDTRFWDDPSLFGVLVEKIERLDNES